MISIPKKCPGFTILLLTVTLLLISTLFILFAARYSTLQQKITSTFYANQQAFEAAQAGIEAAIPYFKNNSSTIIAAASGGYLQPYLNSSTQNVTLTNGSQYSFVYSNPTINNFSVIKITATGTSPDGTAVRTLVQLFNGYSAAPPVPQLTLTTKGNITLNNNTSLNNTTGTSNINAGGTVSFANAAHTTTSAGTTSSSSSIGSDIQQNNTTLSSMSNADFFQNIFGTTQSVIQNAATYTYTNSSDHTYALDGITGAIIWINQTGGKALFANNATIGSAANPVIIIVNGNLDIANNVTIYGFVFTMNSTSTVVETNSVTINGGMASTGNIQLTNAATINYSSTILNALPAVSSNANYGKVPGSWRDF